MWEVGLCENSTKVVRGISTKIVEQDWGLL